MKINSRSLYFFIFLLPIIGMILINEYTRLTISEKGYQIQGVTAINSAKKLNQECSWICHNNTSFCKQHHVKLAKPYFNKNDPIYFGIINSLKSTGNYGLANVIFLVILFPLLMVFLFIKSVRIQIEIRQLKVSPH